MKITLLRLLPVSVLLLGLNSCIVAPGPAYVGAPGVSVGVGGGGDAGDPDDDGPPEMGYWGPDGVYSAVFLPGYAYGPVFYDGFGHRARYGHFNRHGHALHGGSKGGRSGRGTSSTHHTSSSHTSSHTSTRTVQSTHHTTSGGGRSFKTAQKGAPAALKKKKP